MGFNDRELVIAHVEQLRSLAETHTQYADSIGRAGSAMTATSARDAARRVTRLANIIESACLGRTLTDGEGKL